MKKNGFSLVELLIVLVIVLMLVAVGVPSLRNSQENSKNQRASAFLIELGSAVKANRITNNSTARGQITSDSFKGSGGLKDLSAKGLLKNIMWDYDGADTYNGYKFYVCGTTTSAQPATGCIAQNPTTGAWGEACVPQRLAVMVSTSSTGRFHKERCAWITSDGRYENNYDMTYSI